MHTDTSEATLRHFVRQYINGNKKEMKWTYTSKFRLGVLLEDMLIVLSYWPVPKGKDCPQATSRTSVFVNAYNHMHFNVRKSAVAIDCRIPLPNSEKQPFSPVQVFTSWAHSKLHVQNPWCTILIGLKNKRFERCAWALVRKNLFFSPHINPEAFNILKNYQARSSRWNPLLCRDSAQVGLFWLGTRVRVAIFWFCHQCWRRSKCAPILAGLARLQGGSSRPFSKSLWRGAPSNLITGHTRSYRPGLKGSCIFYAMNRDLNHMYVYCAFLQYV